MTSEDGSQRALPKTFHPLYECMKLTYADEDCPIDHHGNGLSILLLTAASGVMPSRFDTTSVTLILTQALPILTETYTPQGLRRAMPAKELLTLGSGIQNF